MVAYGIVNQFHKKGVPIVTNFQTKTVWYATCDRTIDILRLTVNRCSIPGLIFIHGESSISDLLVLILLQCSDIIFYIKAYEIVLKVEKYIKKSKLTTNKYEADDRKILK